MTDRPARELPRWVAPAAVAAALAALVAASFTERWELLASHPFPVGIDGYFYPIQLRSLLETYALHYPSAPLGLWLMAPLAAATDPITGAKLGAALYGALIALPAYAVGARLGRGRGAGLVAAVLATKSAGSAYLSIEFVKNGIGLGVALAAVWLVLRALEAPSGGRQAAAIAGFAAAMFTHKMAAGLVAIIAVPAVIAAGAGRGRLRGRRLLYRLCGLAAAVVALAVIGLVAPRRLLSPGDAALAEGLFTADARWDAPAFVGRSGAALELGHEALIGCWLAIAALLVRSRWGRRAIEVATHAIIPREHVGPPRPAMPPGDAAAGWTLAAIAIVLGLPWLDVTEPQGLGFRLRIAAFVPLALVAALVAGRVLAHIRHRDLALAALALALAFHTPGERDEGLVPTHPAVVTSIQAMTGRIPPGDVVIVPERKIAYMITWYLRVPARTQPGRIPAERRWRVMLRNWIGVDSPLHDALLAARDRPGASPPPPIGLHPSHPNGMVLVSEAAWQALAAALPPGAPWARWPTR